MERLTMTSDKGGVAFTFDLDITCKPSEAQKILKLAERLKEYEDLEEQGLLVKLPCSVGSKLYDKELNTYTFNRVYYYDGREVGIVVINDETGEEHRLNSKVVGNMLFLTQEEAEQALKRLESEQL